MANQPHSSQQNVQIPALDGAHAGLAAEGSKAQEKKEKKAKGNTTASGYPLEVRTSYQYFAH